MCMNSQPSIAYVLEQDQCLAKAAQNGNLSRVHDAVNAGIDVSTLFRDVSAIRLNDRSLARRLMVY